MENRTIDTSKILVEFRQDYINLDNTAALSAEGVFFKIGDKVCHEGSNRKGETSIIIKFTLDTETRDVKAHTDKGWGRISFMYHL